MPRKKPDISIQKQKRRLEFEKYKAKTNRFWNNVVFSVESKFEVFGKKKCTKVWRVKNQEFEQKNITSTVKHGGGSVMVWGCMAASGVGTLVFIDSTMNKTDYLNIKKKKILSSVEKLGLGQSWIFQQDNDPKHTAKIVKEWLL